MNRNIDLMLFFRYNGLSFTQESKKALTHNSFDEKNNGSKYAFAGMYQFKGLLAGWIFKNITGTGTQLQQYLGNISSVKYYSYLFDYLQLHKQIRYKDGLQIDQQKHVFTAALLGYITTVVDESQLNRTIYRFFIAPNDHLLPQTFHLSDPWQKLLFLCKQQGLKKPVKSIDKNEKGLFTCTIILDGNNLATHQSISYIYAQKKALRMALKAIVNSVADVQENDPAYKLRVQQQQQMTFEKLKQEKSKIQTQQLAKQQQKLLDKAIQKKKKEELAQLENEKRRLAKQRANAKKSKKGKDTLYREYSTEEINNLSISKRRNLEDRGILSRR